MISTSVDPTKKQLNSTKDSAENVNEIRNKVDFNQVISTSLKLV